MAGRKKIEPDLSQPVVGLSRLLGAALIREQRKPEALTGFIEAPTYRPTRRRSARRANSARAKD